MSLHLGLRYASIGKKANACGTLCDQHWPKRFHIKLSGDQDHLVVEKILGSAPCLPRLILASVERRKKGK